MIVRMVAGMSTAAAGAVRSEGLPHLSLSRTHLTHTPLLCRHFPSPSLALHISPDSSVSAKKHKPRLDELCQERFPQHSRTLIQSWILQGKVLVDGQPLVKAGVRLSPKSDVKIIAEVPKYVCRFKSGSDSHTRTLLSYFKVLNLGLLFYILCNSLLHFQSGILFYGAYIFFLSVLSVLLSKDSCGVRNMHFGLGEDLVDGSTSVQAQANIQGYKLEAAIEHFKCDVAEKVALDAGLSTGGFTDCLLQSGAACVYGVDVGYGQVAEKIRTDGRVQIFERTNLRHLSTLPQLVDIATLDLSFISILTVMPAVCALMKEDSSLITLIKPQFEAQRSQVGSGGIVRDPAIHKEVIERVTAGVKSHGFSCEGWIESPMKGADGNIEFLACFKRSLPNISSPSEENPFL